MTIRQDEVWLMQNISQGPFGLPSSEVVIVYFLIGTEHLKLSLDAGKVHGTEQV